jgi:hypothetical protein
MKEKIRVLIASVKAREEQLKIVLKRIYDKVDEIDLVLNWYEEVPDWIKDKSKIFAYVNPNNKNAHDEIWNYSCENFNGYIFICDDDLYYPDDYFEKLIDAIERHDRKCVITAHGSNIIRPVKDYFSCRTTYGFSDWMHRDIFVDMAGVGCTAFHSSTIKPTLQDFPILYCRDLWFSILCVKKNIKIVSLQRPAEWIRALQTSGDTVYEISQNNKKLKTLKDRILKEQLLPLLFCDKSCNEYVCITDYDFDKRLLDKSLKTLNNVNYRSNVVIFSNKQNKYIHTIEGENFNKPIEKEFLTQYVTPEDYSIGRMGSKVITQYRFIKGLPTGSKVISADADLYYLKNPFEAFEKDFDIAVTTRGYNYKYPINAGVVMMRVNDKVRGLLNFIMNQIYERNWDRLIDYQNKFNHSGNDWYIDQDIWNCCWLYREAIEKTFGVKIIDIGPKYNFCPHADGNIHVINAAKYKLLMAYQDKSAHILHLKSRLKELVTDGSLV